MVPAPLVFLLRKAQIPERNVHVVECEFSYLYCSFTKRGHRDEEDLTPGKTPETLYAEFIQKGVITKVFDFLTEF